jgi:tetratricopeptide (TPR) repeat protein
VTPGRARAAAALVLLAAASACARKGDGPGGLDPLAEARGLIGERRYDEALGRLGDAADPDAAYLAGRAWAGKAETAPLPAPAAGVSQAAQLKPEEERALGFYERAIAARPEFTDAHLAIAQLLAPHAVASGAASAAARVAPRGKQAGAAPVPADRLVERVLQSYATALQSDLGGTQAGEELIAFAIRVGRPGEADAAFQELVRRRREDPALLVRYGDFLAGAGGKPEAALAQYAQALIWKPDDTKTKLKMADIYLAAAAQHLRDLQYVAAEARLKDARRYAVDPASPQAARLAELEGRLRDVRGR